ncbi:MAG: hypothetical protein ACKPKO_58475, partial [Candidatus Fonsibacter sp.]
LSWCLPGNVLPMEIHICIFCDAPLLHGMDVSACMKIGEFLLHVVPLRVQLGALTCMLNLLQRKLNVIWLRFGGICIV